MFTRRFVPIGVLAGLLVLVGTASAAAVPNKTAEPAPVKNASSAAPSEYAKNRVLVQFKDGVGMASVNASAAKADGRVVREIERFATDGDAPLVVVRSTTQSTTELVEAFSADPRVEFAEPDYILHADATPNDPSFGSLWGMARIGAPSAWDLTTGSSSVVVADIDSGVDYNHPDLAANMWTNPGEVAGNGVDDDANGWVDDVYGIDSATAYGNTPDGDPMDDHGHGTHTSGTMAAVGNNGVGVAGVCWQARIMALRFLVNNGSGGSSGYTSEAVTCVNYAIDQKVNHGVNVVALNNSWGGGSYSGTMSNAIYDAAAAGIVFVAAAGNDSNNNDTSYVYPACYGAPNIISVAASTNTDTLASFSNYGASTVDLAAPGVAILSTLWNDTYASWNGTSMATPHVTGAVALLAAKYPGMSATWAKARLLSSVDAAAGLSGYCATGGRLNVARALANGAPEADDNIPGVILGPSPVNGTLSRTADVDDVYRLYLAAGQTAQISVSGDAGTDFDLYLMGPGTTTVDARYNSPAGASGVGYPDGFSFTATTAGIYYLDVYAFDGAGAYAVTHNVTPDLAAPTTALLGHTATGWVNHDVTLTLQATDDISGVQRIEYVLGGGAWSAYTAPIFVGVEGETSIAYHAVDVMGNQEVDKTALVRIDKTGPITAGKKNLIVKKRKKVTFGVRALDRTPTAKFTVKIYKGKKLKKTLNGGKLSCNTWRTVVWKKCTLAKGKYTWKVYATDEAGNAQVKIGGKGLTVK